MKNDFSKNASPSKVEEVRLIYRNKTKASDRPSVQTAHDAFLILHQHWDMDEINLREEAKILLLDRQLRLMSIASISKGGMDSTLFDPRIVFSIALKRRAHRIIMAHNHPSGSLKPSESDLALTGQFIKAGGLLQINVDDHIIITQDDYCSLMTEYDDEIFCEI